MNVQQSSSLLHTSKSRHTCGHFNLLLLKFHEVSRLCHVTDFYLHTIGFEQCRPNGKEERKEEDEQD